MDPVLLKIEAFVGETEVQILVAAARLLASRLASRRCEVRLACHDAARSDFLGPDAPPIPEELAEHNLVPPQVRSYCETLYRPGRHLVVLSLAPDVLQTALRHRTMQYRFLPLPGWQRRWTTIQRQWVADHFVEEPVIDVKSATECWRAVLAGVQAATESPPLVCNLFRHVPGAPPHRYFGTQEFLGERIRRFNQMLIELSGETGAFVVDLDRALGLPGARDLNTDYRLGGTTAIATAAVALVDTLTRAGLSAYLDGGPVA